MTQRYEEVSNCRLFKTILYLHCRAAACALPTVLGVTACFCCKKFCFFLEVFLLLQPEKRILMTNRFHAQLTRLLLPLPDKSVKLTSFSPEGLQMCGVCLNTHNYYLIIIQASAPVRAAVMPVRLRRKSVGSLPCRNRFFVSYPDCLIF